MTENGDIAKTIGAALAVPLKAAGLRKRANSFNRTTADGLVHHSHEPYGKPAKLMGQRLQLPTPVASWVTS